MTEYTQEFIIKYAKLYEVQYLGLYSEATWFTQDWLGMYREAKEYVQSFVGVYSAGKSFTVDFDVVYDMYGLYTQEFDIRYRLLDASFTQEFVVKYDLNDHNLFTKGFDINYALLGKSLINVRYTTSVTIDGEEVDIYSLTINENWNDFVITASIEIADTSMFNVIDIGQKVVITTPYTVYNLMVLDKNPNEQRSDIYTINTGLTVLCVSETIHLVDPYHKPISKVWSAPVKASAVIAELVDDFTLDYDMYDWLIPANVITADNDQPLNIIRNILNFRGVARTLPDNSIIIQQEFPIGPEDWADAVPDYTVSTDVEIMGFAVAKDERPGTNKVIITNQLDTDKGYQLDAEMNDDGTYTVKLYQVPYKEAGKVLETSSDDYVVIESKGVVEELIKEEVVEIIDGKGSVSKPIYKVKKYYYQDDDLGSFDFQEEGSIAIDAGDGNSILVLSYYTKFREYRVISSKDNLSLVYVEE